MNTRPQSALTALLFDSDEGNAHCRLYQQAERIWVCPADAPIEQIHQALNEIEQAAHTGAQIVLSLSFEAYRAFSSSAHLPPIDKPQADADIPRTPMLQAVAFRALRLLDKSTALAWLDEHTANAQIHLSTPTAAITAEQFHANIADIRERIAAGQTYQVNLTYPYRSQLRAFVPTTDADVAQDAALYATFAQLIRAVNVPYAGLLLFPENSLLSFSPELFFEQDGLALRTRPMKGTAPIGQTAEETERIAHTLANDPKNRAENLMILDLLRNDVARLAQTRSVHVPDRFRVQSYGSILQMTSTVQADLHTQPSVLELFDALFPCGSITGAPKHETIRIIQAIEPFARGAYCGAIGYIQPSNDDAAQLQIRMNVAIRTLETRATPIIEPYGLARWPLQCSVGAGITYDSEAESEWQECALKSQFLARHTTPFELIETMRLERNAAGQWRVPQPYLHEHQRRMTHSALTLGLSYSPKDFDAYLHHAYTCAEQQPDFADESALRLRVSLREDGTWHTQLRPLEPYSVALFAIYADTLYSTDPMRAHKTSMRAPYNRALAQASAQGLFDYVFVNEKGEVTEGARSCIFVQIDGVWYTPPLSCGVLPSVARTLALDSGASAHSLQARERVLTITDIRRASRIMLGNALYGLLPARERVICPVEDEYLNI